MENPDKGRDLDAIVHELVEKMEKIGCYMQDVRVATTDENAANAMVGNDASLRDLIGSGEAEFVVMGTFTVGDVAFTTRVLDPDQFEVDKEAQIIMPTEAEILKDKLRKAREEGRSIFDLDPDETEGDLE